jgi:drug/metabolite transporter (DMT)-like permease
MALIQVTTGALLLAPMVPWNSLPATTNAWAALVTLGVVHTGLMYVLLYGAIQKLPTAITGALSFIYPIAAIISHEPRRMDVSMIEAPQVRLNYGNLFGSGSSA